MNFEKVPELPDVPPPKAGRRLNPRALGGALLLAGAAAAYWRIEATAPKHEAPLTPAVLPAVVRSEGAKQDAEAAEAWAGIARLDAAARGHLRKREIFLAGNALRDALGLMERTVARRPQAGGGGGELALRIVFLGRHIGELAAWQDEVYALLLPLPGNPRAAMLRTEVPQALFAAVMGANPSRHAGPALPVDAVTHAEAEEFCRRLGWVLGCRVRLPAAVEFRAAAGMAPDPKAAWGPANSGGQSRPCAQLDANAAGFHDLLDNVAEWLAAENDGAVAPVAGGDFATGAGAQAEIPMRLEPRTERSARVGFRVLVETDLAAPLR